MSLTRQVRATNMSFKAASAPYNFVPLPEKPIAAEPPPDHDSYVLERHTGYFEVKLTTLSPLYIRAGLSTSKESGKSEYELAQEQQNADSRDVPFRNLMKNTAIFFSTRPDSLPVIPGSSLRGMVRSLIEIATYGKFGPMSDGSKVFYRAVAAGNYDSLGQTYSNALGRFGKNVCAGYLHKLKRVGKSILHKSSTATFLRLREGLYGFATQKA